MSWTSEELAVLKLRADQGLSAGQIAAYLPDKSRNAVIGMLKRGNGRYGRLQGQPTNHAIGRATRQPPSPSAANGSPAARRALLSTPTRGEEALVLPPVSPVEALFVSPPCTHFSRAADEIAALGRDPDLVVREIAAERKAIEAAEIHLPATLPIAFLDAVMRNRCLYFAGEWQTPDGPDMPVCGAERAAEPIETRYCRRHQVKSAGVAA
ncbi:GcrA family cell cycle regulator [Mesorhizobium captivum]|uniref:GcrA family cell cycle regulator n=1 Tax=Mesorhizobium captivum TaxID=3072319 RepID=UPI002A249F0B|nr:GcrA family cell cycle regulator [Mesorhizobium sp. VK23E]MDX8513564.1 GcrA family cell cycle regulator [Mesorhizobium sp. VK23E]